MIDKSNYSISPITQKQYIIPSEPAEAETLNSFLNKNSGKEIVVVQGLGFVGAVMSLICANAIAKEYIVLGVDLPTEESYWRIASINDGLFPVKSADPKIEEFYGESRKKGNFLATFHSISYAVADIIIVDINLDVQKQSDDHHNLINFDVDLSGFKSAINTIAYNCKEDVLILIETTVPPGSTEKLVRPIIERGLHARGLSLDHYRLGHSYERVMPGPNYIDSIQNFYRVYSGIDEASASAVEEFLRTIIYTESYPLTRLGNTTATEMAKVLENSFRAMNIAFIVEWSRFAEEAGVNLFDVVNAIRMRPTHKNMMLPGIGVGGYCLTKDPLLASWSRLNLFESKDGLYQSEVGVKINDKMPQYAFEFLIRNYSNTLNNKRVLLLGVSYLNDVGDTRYSPVDYLFDLLNNAYATVVTHDPYVNYWEEKETKVECDLKKVMSNEYEIIIISTGHSEYKSNRFLVDSLVKQKNVFILDTINIFTEAEIEIIQKHHEIKILGRGDV